MANGFWNITNYKSISAFLTRNILICKLFFRWENYYVHLVMDRGMFLIIYITRAIENSSFIVNSCLWLFIYSKYFICHCYTLFTMCTCHNCKTMSTNEESVCWKELVRVQEKCLEDTPQASCITEFTDFKAVCRTKGVLDTANYH